MTGLYATSFVSGAAIMLLEILGFRLLPPYFGYSMAVWGALLGVVLAALSVGYYAGGALADRHPRPRTLYLMILVAAGYTLLVLQGHPAMLGFAARFELVPGVTLAALLLLALPMTALSTVSPLLIRHNGWIAKRLVRGYTRARESNLESIRSEAGTGGQHVIICGYGRSGQNLAWMLEQEGAASIALDLDPVRVRDARDAGKPVVYGDATRRDVLEAAGLHRARALVISFNDTAAALKILETARHARPDMPVIVRTMDDADLERLKAAGATEVVPESLEGSLMMGSHMLLLLGVPVSRIVRHVRDVRRDRYRMLRGFFHGADLFEERESAAYQERLHSVSLPEGARAVGKLLSELHLEETGVSVSAVRRGGIRGPMPAPETRLAAGDVLVLYGAPEALEEAEKILLEG